jgi:hypothetical protein
MSLEPIEVTSVSIGAVTKEPGATASGHLTEAKPNVSAFLNPGVLIHAKALELELRAGSQKAETTSCWKPLNFITCKNSSISIVGET